MSTFVLAIALLFFQTPQAAIEGVVLRAGSNESIAGVNVRVYPFLPNLSPLQTTTTDNNGRFAFTGLNAGDYSVSYTATFYPNAISVTAKYRQEEVCRDNIVAE